MWWILQQGRKTKTCRLHSLDSLVRGLIQQYTYTKASAPWLLVSSRARCTRPRAVVPCFSFVPVYSTHDAYTRGSPPYIHDGASSVLLYYSRGTQKYERRRWCCNSSRLYFCIELLGTEIIDTRCCLGWWRKTYGKMREKTMQTIFSQREIQTTKQIDAKVLLLIVRSLII